MSGWKQDLEYGDRMAEKVLQILGVTQYRKMEGNFKEFDYITMEDGKFVLREMKADRWTAKTGNLAVECMNRGKLSGISTSHADFWNFYIEELDELYNIPTCVIKDAIFKFKFKEIKECGEMSICYLFDKDDFKQYRV